MRYISYIKDPVWSDVYCVLPGDMQSYNNHILQRLYFPGCILEDIGDVAAAQRSFKEGFMYFVDWTVGDD